ncbi:MAG: 30S ribosomal protein S12 methylthiotransferase RimO, partial [Muribaculaceae bacterium]|nr:30S ribosomal protein S12 methylthiotransferase RimO [Muribaculaceae bacterium]
MRGKIDIISLGCSKNLVDSEHLIRQFEAAGYAVEHNPSNIDGEIVVVNTCGFIADAQEESINTILEMGEAKRQG